MNIIDFHCDTILKIYEENSELKNNNFSVDINKLKAGNSLVQFFALFVDLKSTNDPLQKCLNMLDRFYLELDKNKDSIAIARNYNELISNKSQGKISAFLTIEEGGVLKGRLSNLRNFQRLGVKLITLTWNFPNEIGYPNIDYKYYDKGLTPFGLDVVEEMNNLKMIIDVSHLSDKGFYDVAKYSKAPFIASHSNARAITNHPRNLTDDMIVKLANKGGVMGLNFCSAFLGKAEVSTIESMVAHLKHIKNVGGIDVIALGTDYDGIENEVEIKDIGEIGILREVLLKEKFTNTEIDKIFYKNAERVLKDCLK